MKLFKLTLISVFLPCLAFAQTKEDVFTVAGSATVGSFSILYRNAIETEPKRISSHIIPSSQEGFFNMKNVEEISPKIKPNMITRIEHAVGDRNEIVKFKEKVRSTLYDMPDGVNFIDEAMLKRVSSKIKKGDLVEIAYSRRAVYKGLFSKEYSWERVYGGLKLKSPSAGELFDNLKNLQRKGVVMIDAVQVVRAKSSTYTLPLREIAKEFGVGENEQAIAYMKGIAAKEAQSPGTYHIKRVIVYETVSEKALKNTLKYVVEPAAAVGVLYGLGSAIINMNKGKNQNSAAIFQDNRSSGKQMAEVAEVKVVKKSRASVQ